MNPTQAYGRSVMPLCIGSNAKSVLATLIYSDIFSYPLTAHEIFERSTLLDRNAVTVALNELLEQGIVFFFRGFYSLVDDEQRVEKRLTANALAQSSLLKAERMTRTIKRFPFVRAVMLSGSISKNYMDKDSDIDYFIVTAPNRLWVSRLFFVLYQKLVFFNNYKYFCYNYMVDEEHIAIADKSFYTAMETVSLLPAYNYNLYNSLLHHNAWSLAYLPNYPLAEKSLTSEQRSKAQKLLEPLFNNGFGEWLDKWLMKKIEAKWKKSHPPEKFGSNGLQLKRHTAKAHTDGHYNRIMTLYDNKKKEYEQRYNIAFDERPHLITPIKLNA